MKIFGSQSVSSVHLILAFFILIFCLVRHTDPKIKDITNDGRLISKAEEAIDKAVEYTGFGKMKKFSKEGNLETAGLVVISDDKTPFLHSRINNREIWRVVFRNVKLSLESHPGEIDQYDRRFEVLIDPETGQLLKISSKYEGKDVDFLPEPSIERAESQLGGGRDVYLDFVEPNGYVSFYEAVNSYGTLKVKEIMAHLVKMPAGPNKSTMAVWSITFRGIPPRQAKGPGADRIPIYERNFVRNVYDAATGRLMHWTSDPTPELKDTVYLNTRE